MGCSSRYTQVKKDDGLIVFEATAIKLVITKKPFKLIQTLDTLLMPPTSVGRFDPNSLCFQLRAVTAPYRLDLITLERERNFALVLYYKTSKRHGEVVA